MTREESYDLLIDTIAEIVNIDRKNIKPDTSFAGDLGLDAPGMQALAIILNERYAQHDEYPELTGDDISKAVIVRRLEVLIWRRIGR